MLLNILDFPNTVKSVKSWWLGCGGTLFCSIMQKFASCFAIRHKSICHLYKTACTEPTVYEDVYAAVVVFMISR